MSVISRSIAAWIVLIDSASSEPPHIHPPIAHVPKPIRDTVRLVLDIVVNSMRLLFVIYSLLCSALVRAIYLRAAEDASRIARANPAAQSASALPLARGLRWLTK